MDVGLYITKLQFTRKKLFSVQQTLTTVSERLTRLNKAAAAKYPEIQKLNQLQKKKQEQEKQPDQPANTQQPVEVPVINPESDQPVATTTTVEQQPAAVEQPIADNGKQFSSEEAQDK